MGVTTGTDPAELQGAALRMEAEVARIQRTLTALQGGVCQLQSSWQGEAADRYKKQFSRVCRSMEQTLGELSAGDRRLGEIAGNYQRQEKAETEYISNVSEHF